jgi:hypothetical protein
LCPLDAIGRKLFDVELHQRATPDLVRPWTAARCPRHLRRRRVLTWIFSWRFDEAIAGGADPTLDTLLDCRAEQLVSPKLRRRLAEGLRDTVERAALPRPQGGAAVQIDAQGVRASSGLMLALAARLDSDDPVRACGVARARRLLTDGGSELYSEGGSLPLQGAIEAALIGLGT